MATKVSVKAEYRDLLQDMASRDEPMKPLILTSKQAQAYGINIPAGATVNVEWRKLTRWERFKNFLNKKII